jgi:hypothetical protein
MSDGVKILIAVGWAVLDIALFFSAGVFVVEWWHQWVVGGAATDVRWWNPVARVGRFTFFIVVIGYLGGMLLGWW